VTQVYVDRDALASGPDGGHGIDADAVRSLGFLEDSGHEIVLVGELAATDALLADRAGSLIPEAPVQPDEPAWYLTTDVERCIGRSARLRTVLVGTAPEKGAIHRCDAIARDLQAAVLEILAAEAMPAT
jgi:hypothetical protein